MRAMTIAPNRRWRQLAVAPLLLSLTACDTYHGLIVANESPFTVQLRYTFDQSAREPAGRCISGDSTPLGMPTPRDHAYPNDQWREVEHRIDPSSCEIVTPIASGHSVLLYVVHDCEKEYPRRPPAADAHPRFSSLIVDGAGMHREWRDWEVSRQFKRTRGPACVLAVRPN